MARPLKKIDPEQVENLAAIGCTVSEIAAFVNCSKRTLETRFCVVIEKGRERMKLSLRRMQYESANKGNVTMQIWLGKQYLGQRDKEDTQVDINIQTLTGIMRTFAESMVSNPGKSVEP